MADTSDREDQSIAGADNAAASDTHTHSEPKVPENHGTSPKFADLLRDVVIPIQQVKRDPLDARTLSARKYEIVDRFVRTYRWTVGDDVYPAMRLLLPERDSRIYNVKESKLGDLFIKMYKIPASSPEHTRIKNWKRSAENSFGRGDLGFAEICCEAIRFRGAAVVEGNVVTVEEINQFLDAFGRDAQPAASGQLELLHALVAKMNLDEIRYLIKIMLKLKLLKGMERSLLYTWHQEAPRLLDLVNDLRSVCHRLYSPRVELDATDYSIKVGYPFKPQLASRTNDSYEELVKQLPEKFFLEEKLDGERMQLHMDRYGESFSYFSRKAINYTSLYGADYETGSFTKFIRGCFSSSVKNLVLDGEMVVYDHKRKALMPFGFLKGSALSTISNGLSEDARPMFVAYDLLYLNDVSFEKASLSKRRDALKKILNPIANVIEVVKHYKVSQPKEIEAAVRKAIEINSEGVILKNPDARYAVAERNKHWIKVKPEYLDDFGEDADLLIIGKTRMHKTSYMCGLRTEEGKFVSFCNIANGISLETYNLIEQKIGEHWLDVQKKPPQQEGLVEFGSKLPEDWIRPEKSLVIQVKARSIDIGQRGHGYKAGTTLYNAYFKELRLDKDYETCMTVEEYREIKSARSRQQKLDEKDEMMSKKRKTDNRRPTRRDLIQRDLQRHQQHAKASQIFELDKRASFLVLSDLVASDRRVSKDEIVKVIQQNGGDVVNTLKSARRETEKVIVISDRMSVVPQALYNEGYDILRPQWIFDSVTLGEIAQIHPSHCLKVSSGLLELAGTRVDKYGDSFTIPQITGSFDTLVGDLTFPTELEMENQTEDEELVAANPLFYLFKGFKFYTVKNPDDNMDSLMLKTWGLIKLYHGEVTDKFDENTTHVIIPNFDNIDSDKTWRAQKEAEFRELSGQTVKMEPHGRLGKIARIIDQNWVQEYIDNFV